MTMATTPPKEMFEYHVGALKAEMSVASWLFIASMR
jgi:hypothetical protein